MASEQDIREICEEIDDPTLGRDLVSTGILRGSRVEGDVVHVTLDLPYPALGEDPPFYAELHEALEELPGGRAVEIEASLAVPVFRGAPGRQDGVETWSEQGPLPGVKNVVAIASGKGGVGKSTVTTNLAVALAAGGARVGLMDADIYGPSGPLMMGLAGKPRVVDDKLIPLENYGVKLMSLGLLTGAEDAQVWRGSMVNSAVRQMLKDVAWGELDYLLVDMPPGTGDAQLTLVQQVPLTGVAIVSTPNAVALADVRKGVTMFRRVSVEILGVVENMSFFVCGECGTRHDIFSSGGAAQEAERQGAPFLGGIPLRSDVREAGDSGTPLVAAAPEGEVAEAFRAVARGVTRQVARVALTTEAAAPTRLQV